MANLNVESLTIVPECNRLLQWRLRLNLHTAQGTKMLLLLCVVLSLSYIFFHIPKAINAIFFLSNFRLFLTFIIIALFIDCRNIINKKMHVCSYFMMSFLCYKIIKGLHTFPFFLPMIIFIGKVVRIDQMINLNEESLLIVPVCKLEMQSMVAVAYVLKFTCCIGHNNPIILYTVLLLSFIIIFFSYSQCNKY